MAYSRCTADDIDWTRACVDASHGEGERRHVRRQNRVHRVRPWRTTRTVWMTPSFSGRSARRLIWVVESKHGSCHMRWLVTPEKIPSAQCDPGADREMVAGGRGERTNVTDGSRAGHDLVDPGQWEGGGKAEGEAPCRFVHL